MNIADPDSLLAAARERRYGHRTGGLFAVIALIVIAVAGAGGLGLVVHKPNRSYPLPSTNEPIDGPHDAALVGGVLTARMTPDGACAWMQGARDFAFLWPPGYRITLHPVTLLDEHGRVIAHGGDMITTGGGAAVIPRNRCARKGQGTWYASPDVTVVSPGE